MSTQKKYRILVAEPSPVVARGICNIVSELTDFEIVGAMSDLGLFPERVTVLKPEAVIINPSLVEMSKSGSIRSLLDIPSGTAIISICYSPLPEEALKHFDATINLFDEPSRLARKLRVAVTNENSAEPVASTELSDREKEILVSVAKGLTNKEIADRHFISIHTVISHRKNITRKTGIKTVSGLTIYAMLNGLIDISEIE